jgi:hypothetical protein
MWPLWHFTLDWEASDGFVMNTSTLHHMLLLREGSIAPISTTTTNVVSSARRPDSRGQIVPWAHTNVQQCICVHLGGCKEACTTIGYTESFIISSKASFLARARHQSSPKSTSMIHKCKMLNVATPLWAKCEGEAHTPKSGNLESSGTPKNSELELKGQNTLHWGVLDVIEKVLKCRCLNWPCIGHLDIFSPSYGQKKGRESNSQFYSRPLKVRNRPLLDVQWQWQWRWKSLKESYNIGLDLAPIGLGNREIWAPKVPGLQPGQFWDSNLGVPGKRATWM